MNDIDLQMTIEKVQKIRHGLGALRGDFSDYLKGAGYSAAPGSLAAGDLSGFPDRESVHSVQCMGSFLNEVAADHLTAFIKTITDPMESIAPWNCARALLESTALAAWFYDLEIDVVERVGRGFAHRHEGLVQQSRFSASAELHPELSRKRIEDVEAKALALGYKPVLDREGKRRGIARSMPGPTELITTVHKREEFYRLMSAVAHGHFWAIQQLSFQIDPSRKVEPAGDGVHLNVLTKSVSLDGIAMLGSICAEAFSLPIWLQCLYFGWNREQLASILERNFNLMGMGDRGRFWKTDA